MTYTMTSIDLSTKTVGDMANCGGNALSLTSISQPMAHNGRVVQVMGIIGLLYNHERQGADRVQVRGVKHG